MLGLLPSPHSTPRSTLLVTASRLRASHGACWKVILITKIFITTNHIITWKVGRMGPSLPPALVWYVTSEIIIRFFPISRQGCYYHF